MHKASDSAEKSAQINSKIFSYEDSRITKNLVSYVDIAPQTFVLRNGRQVNKNFQSSFSAIKGPWLLFPYFNETLIETSTT